MEAKIKSYQRIFLLCEKKTDCVFCVNMDCTKRLCISKMIMMMMLIIILIIILIMIKIIITIMII